MCGGGTDERFPADVLSLRQDDGADCFRSPRVGGTPRERAGKGVIALNGDGSAEFRETASQKGSGGAPALLAASGSAVCV